MFAWLTSMSPKVFCPIRVMTLGILGLAFVAGQPTSATAQQSYPWCAQGDNILHCYYMTREQCEAAVDYHGFCVCLNSPIVCAIHLMYWHTRLDRAPDHVFRSAGARKRHDQIGLAFVEHPLIAQWASFLADFVPLALRDLIRLAQNAPARRPGISILSAPRALPWISTVKNFSVCSRSRTLIISPASSKSRPPQTRTLILPALEFAISV
jgi:hypothetical protein